MRIKDVTHYILKLTKGIFKSKMYNIQFIMTKKKKVKVVLYLS